jgi:hypothetical protein
MKRLRLHRATFALAAVYNAAWGAWSAADPQWLFRLTAMEPLNHPAIFACLGMVIGMYGLAYAEVARRPEHGFALAAVGLFGKVLGPIRLAVLIARGDWPWPTVALCAANDLVWWIPFTLYLNDAWPGWRATWSARTRVSR